MMDLMSKGPVKRTRLFSDQYKPIKYVVRTHYATVCWINNSVLDTAKFSLLVGNIPQYHYLNKLNYIFSWVSGLKPVGHDFGVFFLEHTEELCTCYIYNSPSQLCGTIFWFQHHMMNVYGSLAEMWHPLHCRCLNGTPALDPTDI
jgi:hypothetical protein